MFENVKARFAKLKEDHESVRKVKIHVEKYKPFYIAAPVIFGGGFLSGKYFQRPIEVTVENIIENAPVFNNTVAPVMNNLGNQLVNNLGPCCKIVQDADDPNKLWPMIKVLAEEIAENNETSVEHVQRMLARHFRGELEHVFNRHYRPYGVTTTG